MQLKKVEIIKFKNFENVIIDFERNETFPNVFSIASKNGGGKSTLLQLIFILLHCNSDAEKKVYIKNLLDLFQENTDSIDIVNFLIEYEEEEYYLNFKILESTTEQYNFDLYLDIKDTKKRIINLHENMNEHQQLLQLQKSLNSTERLTPVIERDVRRLQQYINTAREDTLYQEARKTKNIDLYKSLVNSIADRNSISETEIGELELILNSLKNELNILEENLKSVNLKYVLHLSNNKNVVLLETNMIDELLIKLSKSVFLTAPSSQIFLFLSEEEKHIIFSDFKSNLDLDFDIDRHIWQEEKSYSDSVIKAKKRLNNFFTYDFASTELILESFKKASEADLRIKRETKKYGQKYDELTDELKDFLDGKEITENVEGNRVIFKSKSTNKELAPEDLSHGELKKLGIYIWLKYIVEENSIILMDEIDIALHPKWQYELIKDLSKWSCKSQYLLATHSPQILSSTYYKNLIKLDNGIVKRYKNPPLDRDINSIIMEVMESPNFPQDLLELHKKYRKLINDGKIETSEAKKLKEEILEYESEDSSFFQEINFDLELI